MNATARGLVVMLFGVLLTWGQVGAAAADPAMAVGAGSAGRPVLTAAPSLCSPNWIHIYARTRQPVNKWVARIAGTDLSKLVGPAGHVDVTIQNLDGTESFSKPFDRNTPFSASITLNGPAPTIVVTVLNQART